MYDTAHTGSPIFDYGIYFSVVRFGVEVRVCLSLCESVDAETQLGCDFFEHSRFLHLHKTVLNLFSFASPCLAVICVFVAKKVISLDGRTFTHYKVTIFYLCVRM